MNSLLLALFVFIQFIQIFLQNSKVILIIANSNTIETNMSTGKPFIFLVSVCSTKKIKKKATQQVQFKQQRKLQKCNLDAMTHHTGNSFLYLHCSGWLILFTLLFKESFFWNIRHWHGNHTRTWFTEYPCHHFRHNTHARNLWKRFHVGGVENPINIL